MARPSGPPGGQAWWDFLWGKVENLRKAMEGGEKPPLI
jgi:hypothetical protein